MSRQRAILGVSLALVWCEAVRGGVPTGIPMATLQEQQWSVGLGYGYQQADYEAHGLNVRTPDGGDSSYSAEFIDLHGLRTHLALGTLAYGICDNWDVFCHLGVSDAQDNLRIHTTPPSGAPERFSYDGDGEGLAFGFGTRATFCHWGPWRFGGLVQITWLDPEASDFTTSDPDDPNTVSTGNADIELWQTQVALAAVYQIDTLSFWAGPFLEFVEGDLDRDGRTLVDGADEGRFNSSADIERDARAGLHAGLLWEATTKVNCQIEGQWSSDSWFLGVGAVVRPEQLFAKP